MPYVAGESLRGRLEREGPLPLEEALRLTREIAEALDYAHGLGIVHRDIKPENLLLSRGHVLVADFGIALAVSRVGGERLTDTGLSLGTPAYMSPEQAMAEPRLDGRSDQYSLACVLYEMLAGEPPYTGRTAQAIIAKRLSEPVPRLGTVRDVPPEVEAAVTRALARSPADRFSSVAEFAAALSRPAAVRRRPARAWLAAAVLVVAAAVAATSWIGARPSSRGAGAVPAQRQFTFTARATDPAVSPDGRAIVYVEDRRALLLERLAGGGPVVLARSTAWLASPRWSPDGEWLYFTMLQDARESAAIYRVPARGGAPARVISAVGPIDLSPDGRTLARAAGDAIILHDPATGAVRSRFSAVEEGREVEAPQHVAWSPDGAWIATAGLWQGDVVLSSPDGRRRIPLATGRTGPVRWSPGGDALYYGVKVRGGFDLMRLELLGRARDKAGEERVVLSGMPNRYEWLDGAYDLARLGGTLAYIRAPQSQHLWVFAITPGRDTASGRRLSADSRAYDWPAMSRDGEKLAVLQHDEELWDQGNYYTVSVEGGAFTRLTEGPGYKSNASWAPDGSRFAYVLSDSAGSRLVLTDSTAQRLQIGTAEPSATGYFRTSWSADGRTLLYNAKGTRTLVALELPRGTETVTAAPDSAGMWIGAAMSPDARSVVAADMHRLEQAPVLWRGVIGKGSWTRLAGPPGDNMPLLWRADGWIYLFNDPDGDDRVFRSTRRPAVYRMRPDGSRHELVAWLPARCRFGFVSMSGDARRLACAVIHDEPDIWLASSFDGTG